MARVYPKAALRFSSSSSRPSPYVSSEREVFTIWMKSLVMNGNGCNVFNANGDIVYRIDNYNCKHSNEVHLMDLRGSVLFTICRKKLKLFGCWEGHRPSNSTVENNKPCFQVQRLCQIQKRKSPCEVTIKLDDNEPICYRMERSACKSACKIVDHAGRPIAEVTEKQTKSGVKLGDDVSTLVVEPHIDHSLIMGLVVVLGLINHKM